MYMHNEHIHALGQLSSIGCTVQYIRSISHTRTRVFLSFSLFLFFLRIDGDARAFLLVCILTKKKEVKEQRVISGHE